MEHANFRPFIDRWESGARLAHAGGRSGFGRCPVRVGVGHVQGALRCPATRAGFDPARNLIEWPPGLARRGPRAEQVGKAVEAAGPGHVWVDSNPR